MSFIVGNDLSSFQGNINWATYSKNTNFAIIKMSEGSSYIDTWGANNRTQARLNNIPLGYYHFARPDLGNSPQSEAQFFCNLIDGDPIQEGEIIALDFEVTYSDCVNWCKQWLDAVSNHFNGIKPLIYLNQATASGFDWSEVVNAGYGLWLADYTYDPNKNTGNTGKWPSMAFQQWTDSQQVPGISGNVDGDCFFGDTSAFHKYGYHKPIVPPAPVTPPPSPSTSEISPTTQTSTPVTIPNVAVQPVAGSSATTTPVTPVSTPVATTNTSSTATQVPTTWVVNNKQSFWQKLLAFLRSI